MSDMSHEERELFSEIFRRLQIIDQHLHNIMATEADIVVQLNQVNTNLKAANAEIAKVGNEQDTLIKQIADLQALIAAGTVGQALVDAAQAVADQAGIVKTGLDTIDAKVPDAVVGAAAAKA
jgi:hypothetical protein